MYDFEGTAPVTGITGYNTLPFNDQEAVMTHLAEVRLQTVLFTYFNNVKVGPLAVMVASKRWKHYSGGVFDGCIFDSNFTINHVVQLVGYGTDEALGDYWIVRNSWGSGYCTY